MKYKVEVEINQPLNKVVVLFDNLNNLKKWIEGLQSFETLSGILGQEGAKSKLHFKMGKREIDMIETITREICQKSSTEHMKPKVFLI